MNQAPKMDAEEKKPDMSLLPMDLLEEVARAYEFGIAKGYPRYSWRKGFSVSRNVAASRRHDTDFWDKGEIYDKQAKEDYDIQVMHCAMVIFNQLCIIDALKNHPELMDRYKPKPVMPKAPKQCFDDRVSIKPWVEA